MASHRYVRRTGVWTVLFALVLIVLGTYYLLRNTLGFDLPQLEGEAVAAFIAVLGGIALLLRAWQERSEPTGTEQLPRP